MRHISEKFRKNLNNISFPPNPKILVAVSGGVDSMALCDLFSKSNLNYSIAHCNFQLRGNDSDVDEKFVENYCIENQVEFHSKKFNVMELKQSGNFSTQMAARELRYNWFRELMNEYEFDFLATAHHLNDSLETFLINLSRGTGIEGLTGIGLQQNEIIRPLYNFSKKEILDYAEKKQIRWREDSSNAENNYVRNKIRNQIVPVLGEIHPEFLQNFSKTLELANENKALISQIIAEKKKDLFELKNNAIHISIDELLKLKPLSSYLFYFFKPYGFHHPKETEKLMKSGNNGEIRSKSHRLIKNREELILAASGAIEPSGEIIIGGEIVMENPLSLKISKSKAKDENAAEVLDEAKIKFPLKLRKPKTGDVFFPIGLNGSKKLSKFFKDEKYSKLDKENQWLLVDDEDEILYVIGKRIDERFKVTEHTQKFLNIYL